MTYQRKHGVQVKIWPQVLTTDTRNNRQWHADMDAEPIVTKCSWNPSRATVDDIPGQQEVDVGTIITDIGLPGVGTYSRVELFGAMWDVVNPPQLHVGATRHVRHWSTKLRKRPSTPDGDMP